MFVFDRKTVFETQDIGSEGSNRDATFSRPSHPPPVPPGSPRTHTRSKTEPIESPNIVRKLESRLSGDTDAKFATVAISNQGRRPTPLWDDVRS